MRYTIYGLALLALLAPAAPSPAQAEAPPAKQSTTFDEPEVIPREGPEPTSTAVAVLRVTCDPESGLSNPELMLDMLTGQVKDRAIALVYKEAAKSPKKPSLKIECDSQRFGPLPAGVYMAVVAIESFDERLPAEKVLAKLPAELLSQLRDLNVDYKRLDYLTVGRNELWETILRGRKDIENLMRTSGLSLASEEVREQAQARRDAEIVSMRVEVEGLRARCKALERLISAVSDRVEETGAKDPIVEELNKVVSIREAERTRTRELIGKGAISAEHVGKSEIALAEAKAELAKQRRAAAQAGGGDRLVELQRRLEDASIELAENEIKLQKLLDSVVPREPAELAQKKIHIELAERQYRELVTEMNRLQARRDYGGPTVALIPL